jgi:hypothetical protein
MGRGFPTPPGGSAIFPHDCLQKMKKKTKMNPQRCKSCNSCFKDQAALKKHILWMMKQGDPSHDGERILSEFERNLLANFAVNAGEGDMVFYTRFTKGR